jgi:C_GCAxxG_C_C family probable redox protein
MSDTRGISRRDGVKSLALAGAAMAAGLASRALPARAERSAAAPQAAPAPGNAASASTPADAAAGFAKGYNCAQCVLTAFAPGLGLDHQTALKVASGFGGGMNMGSVCGAVTGAFMTLGLEHGGDPKANMAKHVREFTARFKAKHQSVNCSELLGIDLSTVDLSDPEQVKALKEKAAKDPNKYARCGGFVRDAVEIVAAMTSEVQPANVG